MLLFNGALTYPTLYPPIKCLPWQQHLVHSLLFHHAFLINVYLYADIKWGIDPHGLSARRRELTSEAVSRSFQSLWIPRGKQAATGPKSKALQRLQALLKMTHHLRPLERWTSNIGVRAKTNLPIQMAEARQALTRLADYFLQ